MGGRCHVWLYVLSAGGVCGCGVGGELSGGPLVIVHVGRVVAIVEFETALPRSRTRIRPSHRVALLSRESVRECERVREVGARH